MTRESGKACPLLSPFPSLGRASVPPPSSLGWGRSLPPEQCVGLGPGSKVFSPWKSEWAEKLWRKAKQRSSSTAMLHKKLPTSVSHTQVVLAAAPSHRPGERLGGSPLWAPNTPSTQVLTRQGLPSSWGGKGS